MLSGIQYPGNLQDGIKARMHDQSIEETVLYNSVKSCWDNCHALYKAFELIVSDSVIYSTAILLLV